MTLSRATLPRLIALAIASIAASQSHAQTSPYYFRAQEQLSYDSNIFRTATNEKRDAYSTTTLTVGLDQPYGRQRYLASGSVIGQIYKNQDDLNNVGYELQGGMDWEAASHLSGDLRLGSTRSLASFTNFNVGQDRQKVMQTQNSANFRGRYGLASPWAVEATLGYRSVNMQGDVLDNLEVRTATVGLGAIYQPSDLLQLGLAFRYSDGEYPNYALATGVRRSDPYTRNDVDFTAIWKASGLSTLNLRLTATNENHTAAAFDQRDFSGVTGLVGWQYQLTGKTSLGVNYLRDTGDNANRVDQVGQAVTVYGSPSRVTDRVAVTGRWDATAKIRATADVSYGRDRYSFSDGTNAGAATTMLYRVAAQFQYSRALLFSCGVGYSRRNAPDDLANITNDYSATTADCLARLTLQ